MSRRIERVNSLLKEVIAEVIRRDVKNPHIPELITVTSVSTTKDLRLAKVYISVIEGDRDAALAHLNQSAGFIAVTASKKITLRFFPELTFYIDDSVDKQMRIDSVLSKIHEEEKTRE